MVHHLGMARILQFCGPKAFQEEPLLSTFRFVRAQLVSLYISHAIASGNFFAVYMGIQLMSPDLPSAGNLAEHISRREAMENYPVCQVREVFA